MPSLFYSVVNLSGGGVVGQAYSFASFDLCVGLSGLQMCMTAALASNYILMLILELNYTIARTFPKFVYQVCLEYC